MIKKNSIRKKLLVTMMGLILTLLILITIFEIYSDRMFFQKELDRRIELMEKHMEKEGETISDHVAINAENAIASYNFFNISRIIEELIKENENLEYGILMDNSGVAHVHTMDSRLIGTELDSEIDKFALQQTEFATQKSENNGVPCLEFIKPIKIGDTPWGVLRIGFSLAALNTETYDSKLSMKKHLESATLKIFAITLFCAFLGYVAIIYLSKRLTNPLVQLTKFSSRLAEGDFSVKIPQEIQKTDDEIGLLSRTFADMATKLEASRAKLKEHTLNLEQEVAVRKSTEKTLIQTNERFQSVLDNTPAVIYLKDVYGRYLLISNKFENLFHISKEDVIGKTDKDIFTVEMAKAFQQNDQKVLGEGKPLEFEEYAPHDDGIHTYISLKFPLYAPSGNISGICGISTDITDRKKMEENLKKFSHKLVETQESERKRIAQELHDSLGQNLLVISNETKRIIEKYPKNSKDIESWNLVLSTALSSVKEIKEIAHNLRPSELDHFGLEGAVQSLIEKISRTAGIEIHEKINLKDVTISPELEIQIYRIIQEGLNNIMKHSFASGAVVELNILNKSIHIEISDDGRGIESQNNPITEGFGIRGIQERVNMFDGSLKIESARGEGTSLKIDIPLK